MSHAQFKKRIQGELFDCTVQGYNDNGHGTHKIDYALQYGIRTPIQKYIEELQKIQENTVDNKSTKREERLDFLTAIGEVDVLVNYFQYLVTYLNGGKNFPDCRQYGSNFETNKIIMTAAGGNIITIFAKLLKDLLVNGDSTRIKFNNKMLTRWALSAQLREWIAYCPDEGRRSINLMASYDFSDFDYNLLPNKCINNFDVSTDIEDDDNNMDLGRQQNTEIPQPQGFGYQQPQGWVHQQSQGWYQRGGADSDSEGTYNFSVPNPAPDDKAGFFLFRVKTGFKVDAPHTLRRFNMSHGKTNCRYARIAEEKLKLFYPQAVQDNWLRDRKLYGRDNSFKNKAKCRHAIQNMLQIKELIRRETTTNVHTLIRLKKRQLRSGDDITGAIEYIRSVTYSMNLVLQDKAGVQTEEDSEEEWQEVLDIFSSLDTILDSELPSISKDLLYNLINSDNLGSFTNNFMDKRQRDEGLESPPVCNFTIVPGGLFRKLDKIKDVMHRFVNNPRDPTIDGLRITINNIIIEPRAVEGDLVPKIYAEEGELDDLIETFDQMHMEQGISEDLLAAVDMARNQLERESGVAGKTKKIKKKRKKKGNKTKIKRNKSK